MGDVVSSVALRPLSIGEIFDRAVTLLVRNWQPFLTITAIGVLPSELFGYLAKTNDPGWNILRFISYFLISIATMACAVVVAQLYRNQPVEWKFAFLTGLGKLPSALGVNVMIMLVFILPLIVVVGVPAGMGVFRFANIFADLIAVVAVIAGLAITLAMFFCDSYALAALAIEDRGAMDAVGLALGLLSRKRAGRTILLAFAQQVIVLGGSSVAGALAGLATVGLHNPALGAGLEALVVFVASAFGNVLIGVIYFDIAIRSEGYDLQVALDAMS